MNKPTAAGKSLSILLLAAALSTIGCAAGRVDPSSAAALNQAANQLNKSLPMMIDGETQLTATMGMEKKFIYNYKLIHWALDDSLAGKVAAMKPGMAARLCSTPKTRDVFLDRGTTMEYQYYDKDDRYIATLDISLADCADTNRAPDGGAKTETPI